MKARSSARASMRLMHSSRRSKEISREPHPQPRSYRRVLRAGRAVERCAVIRGIPPIYSVDVSRRHRWIRGDWQLFRWLLPYIPGSSGRLCKNPLSGLSRWKIFDNLRRSLVSAALTLLLLLGWTVLPSAWFWTLSVIGIILIPSLIVSILDLLQKPGDVLLGQHLAASVRSTRRRFAQAAFSLICLPYEAFYSLDAIVRTTENAGHAQTTSRMESVGRPGLHKP